MSEVRREGVRARRAVGTRRAGAVALAGVVALAACARPAASGAGTTADGPSLVTGSAAAPAALVGTDWLLEELGGRGVIDRTQATLAFLDSGRVAGSATCNRFTGALVLDGERVVRVGPLAVTRRACLGEAQQQQEAAYLRALQAAERVELRPPYLLVHARGFDRPLRYTRR